MNSRRQRTRHSSKKHNRTLRRSRHRRQQKGGSLRPFESRAEELDAFRNITNRYTGIGRVPKDGIEDILYIFLRSRHIIRLPNARRMILAKLDEIRGRSDFPEFELLVKQVQDHVDSFA